MSTDWLSSIGPGWHALVQPLIDLAHAEGATIAQVKEKFGGLRFYVNRSTPALDEAIAKAEAQSYTICEECGAPGKLRSGGWLRTLCDTHAVRST